MHRKIGLIVVLMACIGGCARAANLINDSATATIDPEYWKGAIDLADHAHGLTDYLLLDLLRLRLATGTMRSGTDGDDDYSVLAQIAIQLGFPGEAQTVMHKGVDAKMTSGERAQRLFSFVTSMANADITGLALEVAKANAAPKGDALVHLGEKYIGYGRDQDSVIAIKAGIARGVSNIDTAEIELGRAYLDLDQRDAALEAFNAVPETDQAGFAVAHLWSIFTRGGS